MDSLSYVMTLSRRGQLSISSAARTRWGARRMLVVDLGDRVVIRPLPDEPVRALVGKYAGRGFSTEDDRRAERLEPDG